MRLAGLLRTVAIVVGGDTGVGVGVMFARREGGGDRESAGAQCEEDECLEVHFDVLDEVDVGRILEGGKIFEMVVDERS